MSQSNVETLEMTKIQRWISTCFAQCKSRRDRRGRFTEELRNSGSEHSLEDEFDSLVKSADFSWRNAVNIIVRSCTEESIGSACWKFERAKEFFWEKLFNVLVRAGEEKKFHAKKWSSRVNSDFVLNLFACLDATSHDVAVYENKRIFSKKFVAIIRRISWFVKRCIEVCLSFQKANAS